MSEPVVHVPLEATNWPVTRTWKRLDQVTLGVWDCPHTTPKLTSLGPYVVRSQDVRSGVFRYDEAARVSESTYQERIERAEPTFGDLLYSREGTYFGIAAEVPENVRVCLGQRMVLIRPDPAKINPRFLRLWLNSPVVFRHIHGFRDGSVAERLNMPTIRGLAIPQFDRQEQDSIAELLGNLDDKIELNRRMNETLEAMARAVFRDWFVDFGPTRRKSAGITDPAAILGGLLPDPTQAPPLAALFPDSFGGNGLPEGWQLERLDHYLELAYGKALTKKDRVEGDYPVYGSGGISGTHNAPLANGPAIIVGRKGTVGSLYWEDRDFFAIDTVFYVVPKTRLSFLFYMLETLGLEHMNTDAAVPGLNRNNVYRLERVFGCEATRNAFADLADQFRAMIRNNQQENQTLAATRDLLLPKLMSGELRLTSAEGTA